MEITQQRQGAVTVLKPAGALVGEDAAAFGARLDEIMGQTMGRFVIDASAIAYADSQGLEVLLGVAETLAERGQSLRLCSAGETLREVLELTDLAGLFEHYTDVNTGVRSFL